jgi:hypothetical protein
MRTLLWKRCRRRRKTPKVCSTCLSPRHQHNTYRRPLALSFWRPSTPSQRERMRRHSLSSCPPSPQRRSPGLHSPPPTKRPRRGVEPISGSVPAPVQASSRYRRSRSGEPPALNAEFEIDPVANAGMPFAFDEVVRGRRHRHRLNAGECEECRGVSGSYSPLLLNAGILIFASRRRLKSWCRSGMQQLGRSRHGSSRRDGTRFHHARHRPPSSHPRQRPAMGMQKRR